MEAVEARRLPKVNVRVHPRLATSLDEGGSRKPASPTCQTLKTLKMLRYLTEISTKKPYKSRQYMKERSSFAMFWCTMWLQKLTGSIWHPATPLPPPWAPPTRYPATSRLPPSGQGLPATPASPLDRRVRGGGGEGVVLGFRILSGQPTLVDDKCTGTP